ncbi:MAG: hypothetical protein HC904_17830 [Blastochloris sp.]|nr:hypothetical protein [Blastochloris sp.]
MPRLFDQSLIGVRVQSLAVVFETEIDFEPEDGLQSAGLGLYYNTSCHYLLGVVGDEIEGRGLQIVACDAQKTCRLPIHPQPVPSGPLILRAELQRERLRFSFRAKASEHWQELGPELDATILSDDYPLEAGLDFAFTGTFAVLAVQDASGLRRSAIFRWFKSEQR